MKFRKIPNRKVKVVVKGILSPSIPYQVRFPDYIIPQFYPVYENQRWGQYDSDDCWCLSAVNDAEIDLNYLLANNLFLSDAINFFNTNGYIVNGKFALSELFHEILCGNLDNGGTSQEAWQSFASRGFIPRSMLNYSQALAQNDPNDQVFIEDYYNINRVTPQMIALAKQFLQYVNIQSQNIGVDVNSLRIALKQSPVNIGIPIPYDQFGNCLWNTVSVPLVTTGDAQHAVSLLSTDSTGNMTIYDQYQPTPKILPVGYRIVMATQGVITPVQPPILLPTQQGMSNSFYAMVIGWWKYWTGQTNISPV